jgi:hypothetical protein
VNDFSHDADSDTAVESPYSAEISSSDILSSTLYDYKIDEFPREFKKDYFHSIDIRFLIIFIITMLVHFSSLFYLERHIPQDMTATNIVDVQQQYVDLLLEEPQQVATSSAFEELTGGKKTAREALDTQTLTGLSEWMDIFADNALESFESTKSFTTKAKNPPLKTSKETIVPSREEVSAARASSRANVTTGRAGSHGNLENEVNNVGLLGMLSGKASNYDYEYIDDVLDYAELNADHFANVLSKLNSIQVPRYNTAGYIISQRKRNELEGGELKRGRAGANEAMSAAVDDIAPLAQAKTSVVVRQTQYEQVPSSDNILEKLQPQPGSGVIREAKDVMRVVQSHKLAMQDCYKQTLKRNPTVRGQIIIRFTVNPLGEVVEAAVVSSTLNDRDMEQCLTSRISRWRDFGYSDPSLGDITYKQIFNFGK